MIIGITGGSGSGKTTLLQLIARQGGVVFDCDAIYHELLKSDPSLLASVSRRFPGTVTNGVLNRKKLGEIVFSQEQALLDLNEITHAAVKNRVMQLLESKPSLAAIDAIGLFESGLDKLCNVTVAVTAPEEMRVKRLMIRDGITAEYAKARIAAQKSGAEYSRLCDYTLVNDSTWESFQHKCLAFLAEQGIMK